MNICVYGASSQEIDPSFLEAGKALGLCMARRGHGLVFGAGDNGMMGAVARGITEGGGTSIGIAPSFFNVDGVIYPHCDTLIRTETMRERKQRMEDSSEAFIMTAGGIGTFEEFFEILTLKQLGRHQKPIVILNTNGYYDRMLEMIDEAVDARFILPEVKQLYFVTEDVESALDYIENDKPTDVTPTVFKKI